VSSRGGAEREVVVTGLTRIITFGVCWESDSCREAAKLKSLTLRDSQSLALHRFRENLPQIFSLFPGSGTDSCEPTKGQRRNYGVTFKKYLMQTIKSHAEFGKNAPARGHWSKEPIPRSISANQLWSAIIILLTNQEKDVREMSQSTTITLPNCFV
jgi:hypothetical protein